MNDNLADDDVFAKSLIEYEERRQAGLSLTREESHAAEGDSARLREAKQVVDLLLDFWGSETGQSNDVDATHFHDSSGKSTRTDDPEESQSHSGSLGKYRLIRELGRGGMGVVYLAHDERLRRDVALKVMLPRFAANPDARARFLREARAAARIVSDNVVTIYEADEVDGIPYIAQQLLRGMPLDEYIRQASSLPPREIVRIGKEASLGLAAAHDLGLVHRDIKPSNLWIESHSDRVKVLDFGLAKPLDGDDLPELTAEGAMVGTPLYMSPEQARGEVVDHRTDLYSLGAVLYQTSTGQFAVRGRTPTAILTSLAVDTPTPVREINPAVPEALASIIQRLLAKDANDRPPSAKSVAAELQAISETDVSPSPPILPKETVEGRKSTDAIVPDTMIQPDSIVATPEFSKTADASTSAKKSTHLNWQSRLWPVAGSRLAALCLLVGIVAVLVSLLGVVIFISTNNGTIEIKTEDKNIKILAENAGGRITILDPRSKQSYLLNAGTYTLRLGEDAAGFEIDLPKDKSFVLKRGAVVAVTIRKVRAPTIAEIQPATAPDSDRNAAEWVLSLGGRVQVDDRSENITKLTDLPKQPFRLTYFNLSDNLRVSESGLERMRGCLHLKRFDLWASSLTDAGLANFKHCKNLEHIRVGQTKLTDEGLFHLRDLHNITELDLGEPNVSDKGMENFKDYKKLLVLSLVGSKVTHAGLEYFSGCKDLWAVDLRGVRATDIGLLHFSQCRKMKQLLLSASGVTDAGIAAFKDHVHLETVDVRNTQVGDEGLAALGNCEKMTDLRLENCRVTDDGLAKFKRWRKLAKLDLIRTQVTDIGLSHLKGCQSLVELNVRETKITSGGIQDFHVAVPACRVLFNDGVIEPKKK